MFKQKRRRPKLEHTEPRDPESKVMTL